MDKSIALLGLIEVLSSLTCGVVILFITYRLLKLYGKNKLHIEHSNTAYNIFIASVLFSVGFMMSGVISPLLDAFRFFNQNLDSFSQTMTSFILWGGVYIAIAYAFAMLICLTGIFIYSNLTPMDEITEIRNNNIGVGLILGVIIITLIMMSKDGVILIIESLVPYPDLPPR